MRAVLGIGLALALGACGASEEPAPAPAPAVAPEPAPTPAPAPTVSTPDTRIGALEMTCGGENFRVAFEGGRAVIVGPGGSTMDLPLLDPQPAAAANVRTYTNGVMTFSREETPEGASIVRFARGRMALQECVTARG